MGNTVSRTAEYDDNHEDHIDDPMDIVEDSDSDDTITSKPDDWSVDEQGERIVPGSELRSSDATLSYADRFAALLAENNIIAKAFQDEFEWVKRNDTSILSAWLVASKIYRDAHASRKHARFEDTADDIPNEWREVVKRASAQPVEDVAYDHYRLEHNMFYLAGRIKNHGLKFFTSVGKFLQEGFDLHDLLLKVEIILEQLDTPKEAVHTFIHIFDILESEARLLQVVPALRELFYECEPPSTPLSPSNQLRDKAVGSRRNLLTARDDTQQNSTTSAPLASPEQDYIHFGSPSPTTSPVPGTPEDVNAKILAAFGKEFRWFDKQRWPAPASWRFISALVYSQIRACNGDVDDAIWYLGRGILPEYSGDRTAVVEAIENHRSDLLVDTILPLLGPLPTAYCRRRLREVFDEGLRRHLDYHWLAERWNERFGSSISRRESDIAVIAQIEEFKEWLQEQSAEQSLIEWIPELFDLLEEDTDSGSTASIDQDKERPYKTFASIFGHEISFRDMIFGNTHNGDKSKESRPADQIVEQEDDETRPTDQIVEVKQTDDVTVMLDDPSGLEDESPSIDDPRPPHTPTQIPSTPRASDILSPSSPVGQIFDVLRQPKPTSSSSSSHRLQSRYKDPRVQRVDPLRYQNRLEEPRRLPNTPTVSHQPPRPRSRARTPESRSCQTCGRAFHNRILKPAGQKPTLKKGRAAVRAAADNTSSGRYPTRARKTPKKFNV
ncbi:hypothetical protein Slin15195_G097730 [Septoria linicola]|uniref:Uncharacterized protein n=1 Tax=Septoria linicola TaxID=215465 RepID=A0A9Q9AWT8_9PEZI|nr:hypothetical protein Slin15195_G097730 [Septoria linicola]